MAAWRAQTERTRLTNHSRDRATVLMAEAAELHAAAMEAYAAALVKVAALDREALALIAMDADA